jgi:predicted Zn finger-like uncharacterized protein
MQRMRSRCNRQGVRHPWNEWGALLEAGRVAGRVASVVWLCRKIEASETRMRLTCPTCGACYEVADSMIPAEGRDVQCSNCGTTWFQPGLRSDRKLPMAAATPAPPPVTEPAPPPPPPVAPAPEPEPAPEPAPEPEPAPDPAPEQEPAPEPQLEPKTEAAPPTAPQRIEIDPAILAILRAEAEREARLRRGEPDPADVLAVVPVAQDKAASQDQDHPVATGGVSDALSARQVVDDDPVATPGLLPDIDQINASLRDTGDRSDTEADASDIDTLDKAPRRRKGARLGFVLALAITAGAVALYAKADLVGASVPTLAPALEVYAQAVDAARVRLADLARWLGNMAFGA